MSPSFYFEGLKQTFIAHGNQRDADAMQAYMKGRFQFYGIKQAPRRKLFADYLKENGLPPYEEISDYLSWLIHQPEREYDYCAIELLLKYKRLWKDELLIHGQYLLEHNSWWDTVDLIATNVLGFYLKKNPKLIESIVPTWIEADDMWLNRTAIIFQLKYKDEVYTDWLIAAIMPHLDSKEFFHQKAIGWALRQYSRFNPRWVRDFVDAHSLKPLSKKEALRLMAS